MGKKIVGLLVIGLVFAFVFPVGSSYLLDSIEKENKEYESTLFVIGFLRVDTSNFEITGFALFGMNNGQVLLSKKIDIQYDGSPILVGGFPPFINTIRYNPIDLVNMGDII